MLTFNTERTQNSERGAGAQEAAAAQVRRWPLGWTGLLGAGWLALLGLMFLPCLWVANSFLNIQFPDPYNAVWNALPADWSTAAREAGAGRMVATAAYLGVMLILWIAYRQVVRRTQRAPQSTVRRGLVFVLMGTFVFGALTIPWPGLFTTDIYLYGLQSRMQVVYHLNPLLTAPDTLHTDPLSTLTPWSEMLAAYGPIWLLVARLAGQVAQSLGAVVPIYVLVYKGLNLLLLPLATALLWAITGRLGWTGARRVEATMLFGWCPLLILDLVGNGHNDMLLVLGILLAIWGHLRGWWPLAVLALMLGGLVKMPGYFLLPAYLVLLARTSPSRRAAGWRLAGALALCAGTGVLAYLPYADPDLPRAIVSNPMSGMITNSWYVLLRDRLSDLAIALSGRIFPAGLTWTQANDIVRIPLWYGPLVLWGVFAAVVSARVREFAGLLRTWALLLLTYLVFAAAWFQPWYISWLLPIVALIPAGRLRRSTMLLALGGTLFYGVYPPLPGDVPPLALFEFYVPGVIFGPLMAYWAWEGARAVLARRRIVLRLPVRQARVSVAQSE